jgi:hypothetical protein
VPNRELVKRRKVGIWTLTLIRRVGCYYLIKKDSERVHAILNLGEDRDVAVYDFQTEVLACTKEV